MTGDDVKLGKPFPDPYLLGAKNLGFDPEDCVVFEDAQAGALAAIEAGVGGDRQPTESFDYGFYFTTSQSSQETGQVGGTKKDKKTTKCLRPQCRSIN